MNSPLYVTSGVQTRAAANTFANDNGAIWLASEADWTDGFLVYFGDDGVELRQKNGRQSLVTRVDFVAGAKAHRRHFGGGKSQAIAKAVGLQKARGISVLDATAGMGADAFVLATLGCQITLVERSPVVRVLLADGLERARRYGDSSDPELAEIVGRLALQQGDSLEFLASCPTDQFQVVYLDPMFPPRKKSAEVKKDMQMFHQLVGADADADGLLEPALQVAENRVVVKRPKSAPFLANREPGLQLTGKSGRFDIYPLKKFAGD